MEKTNGNAKIRGAARAQAAVEALSYGAFFMLMFVGAIGIFLQLQSQDLSRAEYSYAQQIAYGFADHIYVTSIAGTGFVQTVSMPNDLLGRNYNLTISRPSDAIGAAQMETGFVYVDWVSPDGRVSSVSAPTITASYEFANSEGISANDMRFVVIKSGIGRFNVSNVGGKIKISKA